MLSTRSEKEVGVPGKNPSGRREPTIDVKSREAQGGPGRVSKGEQDPG